MIYKLKNKIQEYTWGSKIFIPELLGFKNSEAKPQAELWMGAHPKASSKISKKDKTISLADLIRQNPARILGSEVAFNFNNKLPFLFKVLAAGQPLSIQAHPNLKKAKEGFDRENKAGIPLSAPTRNFKDDNHKPELICALTSFDAMCGFRDVNDIVEILHYLDLIKILPGAIELQKNPSENSLKNFFSNLINSTSKEKTEFVNSLVRETSNKTPRTENEKLVFEWILKLSKKYPGDIGIFSPILLNVIRLQPGEALYLDAGILHAYLNGAGIEIMANSDNVLRGGLTPKHVDVPELLKTLTFKNGKVNIIRPEQKGESEFVYQTPVREFELSFLKISEKKHFKIMETKCSQIMLCTKGNSEIFWNSNKNLKVKKGESIFISAGTKDLKIKGNSEFYRARVP